jgi:hypothetical protein
MSPLSISISGLNPDQSQSHLTTMEKQEKKTKVVIVGEQTIASESSCNEPDLKMFLSRLTGAGIGGVATAARLAHAGFEVEVYEKVGLGRVWIR